MKTIITLFLSMFLIVTLQSQTTCNNYWAVVSPDGNYLYFSSDRAGGDYDIYRSGLDGITNLMRLTTLSGNDFHPSVSPDGSKIVFRNGGYDGDAEIYIMDNDGGNLVQLTDNNVYDGSPSFSPDGQKIVFDAWDESQYPEIFTMNTDGSMRTQLTDEAGAYWQSSPKFNPAGDKIYFLRGFNADNHIVMMDPDGSNWVEITSPNSFGYAEANLFFSPDGSQIIFFTTENKGYNNGGDLVIADADGSNWNFITNSTNGEYYYQGCFHPTNNIIYYTHRPANGNYTINQMDTNGSNSILLSNCISVGMEETATSKGPAIYPNPASDFLHLIYDENEAVSVRVYNTLGRMIYEDILPVGEDNRTLDVSTWPAAIYLVEVQTPKAKTNRKLLINH